MSDSAAANPRTWRRFQWTVALLSVAVIFGAYIDASVREAPPGFLGPWRDAPLEAAWFAVTAFMAAMMARNLRVGAAWRDALPPGYHVALAGGLIFGLGALADVYYQLAFGSGRGLEALLAPPHLLELAGGGLLVSSPLHQALSERPERIGWPVVISAALTLSALTFFTQFANPLIDMWASRRWPPSSPGWAGQNLGVAGLLITITMLVGLMVLLVRSFAMPRGSLTVVCGLNGLCLFAVSSHVEAVLVMLLTGAGADLLLLRLRLEAGSSMPALRIFAAALAAGYALLYWAATVVLEGGTIWSPQLWAGIIMAAALTGLLVSYLAGIRRPKSVAAAEVWAERWPARYVEVSPAIVKEALEVLDDTVGLGASPLVRLSCIAVEEGGATTALRTLLIDVLGELAASRAARDAEAGQLLVDYYVKRVGSHDVIAERLHLSRPTFYRRLQRGLTLAAERLDELEEFAVRQR